MNGGYRLQSTLSRKAEAGSVCSACCKQLGKITLWLPLNTWSYKKKHSEREILTRFVVLWVPSQLLTLTEVGCKYFFRSCCVFPRFICKFWQFLVGWEISMWMSFSEHWDRRVMLYAGLTREKVSDWTKTKLAHFSFGPLAICWLSICHEHFNQRTTTFSRFFCSFSWQAFFFPHSNFCVRSSDYSIRSCIWFHH